MTRLLPLLLAAPVLSLPLAAQLGHSVGFKVDVQTPVSTALGATYDGSFGVARDNAGAFWITTRRATAAGAHKLVKLDSGGAVLASYDQPASTASSANGLRDFAYDGTNDVLYAGCEASATGGKILAFSVATAQWNATLAWTLPASLTNVVGLAYDPFGNANQGSMYASDGSGAVTEFTKTGTVVRTLPAQVPGCTGIAIDPSYRKLWFFGQGGTARPNTAVVAIQVDIPSAQPTGLVVLGDTSVAGTPAGGVSGGIEFTIHTHTDHLEPWLLMLAQGTKDTIYELGGRLNTGSTCGGTIGCTNDAAYVGNLQWQVTLTGSSAANAFLMLAATNTVTPLVPPLFALGCALQVPLTPAPITLGPYPVTGGSARATIPITAGGGGEVWLQWIEVTNPITTPIRLSDGGGIAIHP